MSRHDTSFNSTIWLKQSLDVMELGKCTIPQTEASARPSSSHDTRQLTEQLQGDLPPDIAEEVAIMMSLEQSGATADPILSKMEDSDPEVDVSTLFKDSISTRLSPDTVSSSRDHSTFPDFREDSCVIRETRVVLIKGEIAQQRASALVNLVAPSKNIKESIVSRAFCELGGPEFERMWTDLKFEPGLADHCQHLRVTRKCGKLRCDYVLHVTLKKVHDQAKMKQCLNEAMEEIFEVCMPDTLTRQGCTYIAMPPLGVGRLYNYPTDLVARCMLTDTRAFLQSEQFAPKEVKFVVYDDDTYDAFKTVLDSLAGHSGLEQSRPNMQQLPTIGHPCSNRPVAHSRSARPNRGPLSTIKRSASSGSLLQDLVVAATPLVELAKDTFTRAVAKNNTKGNDKYTHKGNKQSVKEADRERLKIHRDDRRPVSSPAEESEKRRRDRSRFHRGTVDFVNHMKGEDDETPRYWKNFQPGEVWRRFTEPKDLVTNSKHYKVTLNASDPAYEAILKLVNKTFDSSHVGHGNDAKGLDSGRYSKLYVVKIQRIENIDLYTKYATHRNGLFQTLWRKGSGQFPSLNSIRGSTGDIQTIQHTGDALKRDMYWELNEQLFFHGTKADMVDKICDQGVDPRVGDDNAMFGPGVYGAESSTKADQYTDSRKARTYGKGEQKTMLLIRKALGNMYVCTTQNPEKYKRPPCTSCYKHNCTNGKHMELFDSVVGDNGKLFREFVVYSTDLVTAIQSISSRMNEDRMFREFVVYSTDHCYPEYLITYERR